MSYYDYNDYYYDDHNEFNEIAETGNTTLIKTVSHLRHYTNIFGITKTLRKRLHLTTEQIENICDVCRGTTEISDITEDYDSFMSQYNDIINSKKQTYIRHITLQNDLRNARNNFCGIGTRKTKLLLNKLANTSPKAKAYRLALEAEDKSITAKNTSFYYMDKVYREKEKNLKELAELSIENNWTFGKQKSDVRDTTYIIYFELPDCEQISFHTNLDCSAYPDYTSEWDGKTCSTIPKLEHAITTLIQENNTQQKS